ncbi:hypothetical protein Ciccas_006612 [Cichlidogyrus casuarinus]|uniref:Spt4/RpoE2 zinc finger domain-containing protein n=1 Tax=Cichlidogyrus casuarinus TaxID=1844966 RepID=A0ABD2Q5B1_9PLAT
METHAMIPNDLRNLRACLLCGLVKTLNQFQTSGCENCEEYLQMQGDRDEVYSCTSANFDARYNTEKIVINTWPFTKATDAAFAALQSGMDSLDSVVEGCSVAEADLGIHTVGYGGSPDEGGNTTVDALVMDGRNMEAGAVASMPYIKDAIKVAREVYRSTRHTLLVGEFATNFAASRGFQKTDLHSDWSRKSWNEWKDKSCQPNFRRSEAWLPDPSQSCGPYTGKTVSNPGADERPGGTVNESKHDTIGMIAFDGKSTSIGTSTNGAIFRVPGRVGDSPIPGAGGYVLPDNTGAAVATGDGDILMRFLLSFQAATFVSQGLSPNEACVKALKSVVQTGIWYGAVIALDRYGNYGGACVGFDNFELSVRKESWSKTRTFHIPCIK